MCKIKRSNLRGCYNISAILRDRASVCYTGVKIYTKMVFTCCVVNCYNRSGREKGVSFFSIPAVVEHQGDRTKELSMKRRHEWIKYINRKNWTPSKYARVCSDHFHSGKF